MPRINPIALNATQKDMMKTLSRVMFVTFDQLTYWVNIKKPAASEAVKVLADHGLVKVLDKVKPYIIQITHAGARVSGTRLPSGKTYFSWSAQTHRIYRNDAEILLRGSKAGFAMQNRYFHYSLGLNPTHGEHSAIDADDRHYFCMLDDYRMQTNRLIHAWQRRHTPNRDYFDAHKGFRWKDICQSVLIFSTDADQLQRYKAFCHGAEFSADFYYIKPRWH